MQTHSTVMATTARAGLRSRLVEPIEARRWQPKRAASATTRRRPWDRLRRRHHGTVSLLAGVPPFDRYPPRALMPLAAHVDRLRIPEGRALAHEGWRVREVLVVLSGEIIAIRGGEDCARIGPGTHIGAAELLRGGTYSATLLASTGLQLLVINGPAYRWAVQALPGFEPEIDGGLGVWPQVSVAQGPMPPMRSGVMRST